jgi:hypothetical protein
MVTGHTLSHTPILCDPVLYAAKRFQNHVSREAIPPRSSCGGIVLLSREESPHQPGLSYTPANGVIGTTLVAEMCYLGFQPAFYGAKVSRLYYIDNSKAILLTLFFKNSKFF